MKMKLWLISQDEVKGSDVFTSAVVAAETGPRAARIHPAGDNPNVYGALTYWATTPGNVKVKLIGIAVGIETEGVVLASFNAG